MVVRRFIVEFIERYAPWLDDGINGLFKFIMGDAIHTFNQYKDFAGVDPGWASVSGLLGVGTFLLFFIPGMLGFAVGIEWIATKIKREITQQETFVGGAVVYLVYSFLFGATNPVQAADRVRVDSATFFQIFASGGGPQVDITGFTWGLTGNPLLGLTIQFGVLILGSYLLARRFTPFNEAAIATGISGTVFLTFVYVFVNRIQVFPMDGRLGILLQTFIVWVWMVALASVTFYMAYGVIEWVPIDIEVRKPRMRYVSFNGLVLLAFLVIFGSPVSAITKWFMFVVWLLHTRKKYEGPSYQSVDTQPEVS